MTEGTVDTFLDFFATEDGTDAGLLFILSLASAD